MADTNLAASGIYAIRHIASGRRYIGSVINIEMRWRHHRKHLRKGVHHSRFLQRVWDKHSESSFVFEILELVPDVAVLIEREQHWIDAEWTGRASIYNVCRIAGSTRGKRLSEEAIARMKVQRSTPEARAANSARQLGRKRSAETKARHRATLSTPECRERLSAAQRGRKATQEAIEANRLGQTGRRHSQETKEKMRLSSSHRRHSEDTKQKISKAKTGHKLGPQSEAHKAKLLPHKIGRKHSLETKMLISRLAQARGPQAEETKAKKSLALKGRIKTPEHMAKIAASKRANRDKRLALARLDSDPGTL